MRENVFESARDQRIVVFALATIICVFLGPFNTSADLSPWDRVAFWTLAISLVGLFMEVCIETAIASRWLKKAPAFFQIAIGSAIGGVPGSAIVIALNKLFRPEHVDSVFFPTLWAQVSVMGMLIAGLDILFGKRWRAGNVSPEIEPHDIKEDDVPSQLSPARLFQRLPNKLREAQIISMSMQDHYVEVTTTNGSEMILMRLSDAIDLLDNIAGVQTHRSHWAARSHAQELTKSGRKHQLTLSDGRAIPVSSSYKADVIKMLDEKGQA